MMSDGKHNPEETDPEKLARLLELELMQKRTEWQQKKARRGGLRALSFLFLFVVIAIALVGFFLFFNPERVREMRSGPTDSLTPSPTATPR
jgi:hypothetical protein